jgi:hypothetical protein
MKPMPAKPINIIAARVGKLMEFSDLNRRRRIEVDQFGTMNGWNIFSSSI